MRIELFDSSVSSPWSDRMMGRFAVCGYGVRIIFGAKSEICTAKYFSKARCFRRGEILILEIILLAWA